MFTHTLFILYMLMCFLGLGAIILAVIIIKHNSAGNTVLLKATRNFAICTFVLGAFYFLNYYRELVMGLYAANAVLRGIDAIIFYGMGYSWLRLMDAILASQSGRMKTWRKVTNIVTLTFMLLSVFDYVFLLDEYYHTASYGIALYIIFSEIIMGLSLAVFTAAYLIIGYQELVDGASRRYIAIVSLLVNFNNIWNNFVAVGIFSGSFSSSIWTAKLYGITSAVLLSINLITVVYVYKKDFSPFYFQQGENGTPKEAPTEEFVLNLIAEKHKLTEREREIMILAYHGLTNPDIAELLTISRYTVKRHMHNIFEKLDISTRMELVHLIGGQLSK